MEKLLSNLESRLLLLIKLIDGPDQPFVALRGKANGRKLVDLVISSESLFKILLTMPG